MTNNITTEYLQYTENHKQEYGENIIVSEDIDSFSINVWFERQKQSDCRK